MTTVTAAAPAELPTPRTLPNSVYRLSFARVVQSEWIKFTTLRSTWWSIALVATLSLGLSLLMAGSMAAFGGESAAMSVAYANRAAVQMIVFSTVLTQLLAVILGTIMITGEYSTGMIRSTLTAVPGRVAVVFAKALVVAVTMFLTSAIVLGIAAVACGLLFPSGALDLSDPNSSVLPLLGAAFYLAMISVLGVGLGLVIRNGPGAIAAGIGVVFVAPIIALFFPRIDSFQWLHDAATYLPSNAGQSLFMGAPMTGNLLEPLPAIATILVWVGVALAGGITVLKVRDA